MKNQKDIDQFFQDKFTDLGQPDPTNDWSAMESMLDGDKSGAVLFKKRYVVVIALLFLLSAGFFFTRNKEESQTLVDSNRSEIPLNNQINTASEKTIKAINTIAESNTVLAEHNNSSSKNEAISENELAVNDDNTEGLGSEIESNPPHHAEAIPEQNNIASPSLIDLDTSGIDLIKRPNFKLDLNPLEIVSNYFLNGVIWKEAIVPTFDEFFINRNAKTKFGVSPYIGMVNYSKEKPKQSGSLSETTQPSMSYGVQAYAKRGKWNLRLGINYLQLEEKINFQEESYNTSYDTSIVLVTRNFETTEHGKTTALVKKVIVGTSDTTVQTVCLNCQTRFSYIEIPVALQYEWGKSRLKYFAEAGFGVSFLKKADGFYSTELISTDKGNEYIVKEITNADMNKRLWSTNARLGLKYKLYSNLGVYGSYGYKYYHTSAMKSYNQRPSLEVVEFGLEINF
jgi:hypothetical protein